MGPPRVAQQIPALPYTAHGMRGDVAQIQQRGGGDHGRRRPLCAKIDAAANWAEPARVVSEKTTGGTTPMPATRASMPKDTPNAAAASAIGMIARAPASIGAEVPVPQVPNGGPASCGYGERRAWRAHPCWRA